MLVLGHSLVRSLICLHHSHICSHCLFRLRALLRSLIRSLAHSFAPALAGQLNILVLFSRCSEPQCHGKKFHLATRFVFTSATATDDLTNFKMGTGFLLFNSRHYGSEITQTNGKKKKIEIKDRMKNQFSISHLRS